MGNYVESDVLQASGEASESDDAQVWDRLAEAVSRLFDRECEVPDGFFDVAGSDATEKTFRTDGTNYLRILPFIPESIEAIDVDGSALTLSDDDQYIETDGYLIFAADYYKRTPVTVTAKWGFSAIPVDIVQACIEQALFMWRKKDLAFSEMSGVSTAAVTAEFSPTFQAVAKRYREIYSQRNYFS